MLTKEQRDKILRRVEEYTDQARLWATRSVANQRPETRALVDLVAYLDSITAPEGWQMVPVEPTREMLEAADEAYFRGYSGTATAHPASVYAKMLAAAPKPGDSNE